MPPTKRRTRRPDDWPTLTPATAVNQQYLEAVAARASEDEKMAERAAAALERSIKSRRIEMIEVTTSSYIKLSRHAWASLRRLRKEITAPFSGSTDDLQEEDDNAESLDEPEKDSSSNKERASPKVSLLPGVLE